jgi:hypothetical protein
LLQDALMTPVLVGARGLVERERQKGDTPMHHRISRTVAAVVLTGASLTLAGAALVANAVSASADTAGTNVCSSIAGYTSFSTGVQTGAVSGCHQQGSGTWEGFLDPNNPFAPQHGTIHWATGQATSDIVGTGVYDPSVPCPAGDFGAVATFTVVGGAYAGSTGHETECNDISAWPIVYTWNVGPLIV